MGDYLKYLLHMLDFYLLHYFLLSDSEAITHQKCHHSMRCKADLD